MWKKFAKIKRFSSKNTKTKRETDLPTLYPSKIDDQSSERDLVVSHLHLQTTPNH
jgi:hypothetical protein